MSQTAPRGEGDPGTRSRAPPPQSRRLVRMRGKQRLVAGGRRFAEPLGLAAAAIAAGVVDWLPPVTDLPIGAILAWVG